MLAGNAGYDPAATFLIQRVTATGGESSLSFTSIPQTYSSLQVRGIARNLATGGAGDYTLSFRFNSDNTSANYAWHRLRGNGSTATAYGSTSGFYAGNASGSLSNTTIYAANVIDVHDYASTTKYKTVRTLSGNNVNTTSTSDNQIDLMSMLWENTAAVTRIDIVDIYGSGGFAAGTTFALYGMK